MTSSEILSEKWNKEGDTEVEADATEDFAMASVGVGVEKSGNSTLLELSIETTSLL
jgi:hypothetical protein